MTDNKVIYHGGKKIIRFPEIQTAKYNKDFFFGFYCTYFKEQAGRWATRYGRIGVVNEYSYTPLQNLRTLVFTSMTEEWLDFGVECRCGKANDYDIVEGPMADDTIFNYVQGFIDISFHTARALVT